MRDSGDGWGDASLFGEITNFGLLIIGHHGDHSSLGTGSSSTSGAVHINLVINRRIKVDDQGHIVDVDAPGGDIGGNHGRGGTVGELGQVAGAVVLAQVAVHFNRRNATHG